MIVRSIVRCSATRRLPVCRPRLLNAKPRRFSTSSSSPTSPNGASEASMLGAFTSELDRIAPKFEIQGSQIQILRTPTEFYETLKVGGIKVLEPMKMCWWKQAKILGAENRIFLSTLYIGKTEHELVFAPFMLWELSLTSLDFHTTASSASKTQIKTQYLDRCITRNTRIARSIMCVFVGTIDYWVRAWTSRNPHVSHRKPDWSEKEIYS